MRGLAAAIGRESGDGPLRRRRHRRRPRRLGRRHVGGARAAPTWSCSRRRTWAATSPAATASRPGPWPSWPGSASTSPASTASTGCGSRPVGRVREVLWPDGPFPPVGAVAPRAEFDALLMETAAASGARLREHSAAEPVVDGGRVVGVRTAAGVTSGRPGGRGLRGGLGRRPGSSVPPGSPRRRSAWRSGPTCPRGAPTTGFMEACLSVQGPDGVAHPRVRVGVPRRRRRRQPRRRRAVDHAQLLRPEPQHHARRLHRPGAASRGRSARSSPAPAPGACRCTSSAGAARGGSRWATPRGSSTPSTARASTTPSSRAGWRPRPTWRRRPTPTSATRRCWPRSTTPSSPRPAGSPG